jgi:agmatinase
MTDLSTFNVNVAGNPNNNIFGLPFSENEAKVVLLPVPWEVTVSCGAGTSRSPEHVYKASLQVDIFDPYVRDGWKHGFHMRDIEKKVLMKSDYLRKEAELYMDYISKGIPLEQNKFMCKSLRDINEGGELLNKWVYEQTSDLLKQEKMVGVIGGDHSATYGFVKALADHYESFGILQIDAHCDLRKSYQGFKYSHASVMYNVLEEIPAVSKIVQAGIRDFCEEEWNYISNNNHKIITYFDQAIKERQYEGETWKNIAEDIVSQLPEFVYISFDIDGLDPKLCPHTGTSVYGGFEAGQVLYLFKKIVESGRKLIGFDLVEIGSGDSVQDANVGAHLLWKMCNLLVKNL